MIRIGKAVAGGISTAALVLGVCGAASAQGTPRPDMNTPEPSHPSDTSRPDTSKETGKGATSAQGTSHGATMQEHMDKDKAALKDRIHPELAAADANIDALKKMADNDKGDTKKRDQDLEKRLSDQRDKLKGDLDKIDKASTDDWKTVRPVVEHDLAALTASLHTATTVTKVPVPRTGAANKQPSGAPPSEGEKTPSPPAMPSP
jgi:hypothetical protein